MAAINFGDRRSDTYLPQPVATTPLETPPRTTVGTQPVPGTTPQPGPGSAAPANPYANGGTTPITIPPGLSIKAGPAAGQGLPTGGTSQTDFGNLSDPTAWMNLVGNDAQLKAWVTQGLGTKGAAVPGLVDFYVKTIKGQPGANPTEQAGSADYYLKKFQNDPHVTGTPAPAADGTLGYDDPSAQLYLQQLMKTLGIFNTPVNDPTMDALNALALKRVTDLQGDPYTAADNAALITQYRDPLTQARDAAKQQEAEALARRGINPKSGLYDAEMTKIDQAYEGGIAAGSNQLGVNAVKQKQANADESLSILTNLLGVHNGAQTQADQRLLTANAIAKAFPDFDMSRLNGLLAASGSGDPTSSALSSLIGLGNLNNNTNATNNANDSAYSAALAKFIYSIANGIH